MRIRASIIALSLCLPTALAWGAAGHEIVATIAQIHLHPSTREKLCGVLPPEAKCHLAPIAAWADQVRMRYRETAGMHYVNPQMDHPQDHCEYGEHGWINEDVNVLTAIMNKTRMVRDLEGKDKDIPLRFLVHFIGDLHQPLHLTGRDKGGNGAMFRFEGRMRNLHSVWDSGIITKNIRELSNYTSPLPSKQIEDNLLGAIFDPYVRWIVWEGIREWWRPNLESWLSCPSTGDPYPHSSVHPLLSAPFSKHFRQASSMILSVLPVTISDFLQSTLPVPTPETENFAAQALSQHPNSTIDVEDWVPACPYTWSLPLHDINCELAWPKDYVPGGPLIELDTDEYLGKISREKTMEKLLAMAGLRLASVLNQVFSEGKESMHGVYLQY
ncbi:nuclease S1, partial [Tremellales sp. Uapishka_1]